VQGVRGEVVSAALILSLVCDAPHCGRETIADRGQGVTEALHAAGWGRIGQKHYCDHHIDDAILRRPFGSVPQEWF
jgi:hypothetical protein